MTRTLACLLLFAVPVAAAHAALYRYVDPSGRVVYSDQPPPPTVKEVQAKQLQENVIETDPVPFAARDAAARNPVTLYTFDCEVCKQAESLLAKRGVPFTSVIVSEQGHKLILDEDANEVKLIHGSGPEITFSANEIVLACGACEIRISDQNISLNSGQIKIGLAGVSLVNGAMSFGVPP